MQNHFDALETRSPEQRERELFAALPGVLARAMQGAPAMARHLQDIDPGTVRSREALAALPVLRKHELLPRQQAERDAGGDPMGGVATAGWGQLRRVFASPGPIYEPESARSDYWRF